MLCRKFLSLFQSLFCHAVGVGISAARQEATGEIHFQFDPFIRLVQVLRSVAAPVKMNRLRKI